MDAMSVRRAVTRVLPNIVAAVMVHCCLRCLTISLL